MRAFSVVQYSFNSFLTYLVTMCFSSCQDFVIERGKIRETPYRKPVRHSLSFDR